MDLGFVALYPTALLPEELFAVSRNQQTREVPPGPAKAHGQSIGDPMDASHLNFDQDGHGSSPWALNCSAIWLPRGFSGGSAGRESICNVGDLGSTPGLGRSPGDRKGYPFQYSGLQNSIDWFPGGSDGKASACNAGDSGLIPGSGRSPGKGNGNPLKYLAWRIPWTQEPARLQSCIEKIASLVLHLYICSEISIFISQF